MTDRVSPQAFVDTLLPVVDQCARASLIFFGQVADLGKTADTSLAGHEAQDASAVLTALDTAFQDIILTAVHQHFPGLRAHEARITFCTADLWRDTEPPGRDTVARYSDRFDEVAVLAQRAPVADFVNSLAHELVHQAQRHGRLPALDDGEAEAYAVGDSAEALYLAESPRT